MMTGSGISLRVYGEKMEDLQAAAKTVGEAIGSGLQHGEARGKLFLYMGALHLFYR